MASQVTLLRPVQEWIDAAADPGSRFNDILLAVCAQDEAQQVQALQMCVRALKVFRDACGSDREVLVIRSAGRVNILGTHIDHRGGSVNPVSIYHLWLVASPRDDDLVVARNVESESFPQEQFRICECLPAGAGIADWDAWCHAEYDHRRGDPSITWSNYIRAAVLYLQYLHTADDGTFTHPLRGMDMVFCGNIPRAVGLSSSSAVVVATAEAVIRMNGLEVNPTSRIRGLKPAWRGQKGRFRPKVCTT